MAHEHMQIDEEVIGGNERIHIIGAHAPCFRKQCCQ